MAQIVIAIVIAFLFQVSSASANCDGLSRHGIYDYSSASSDSERALAFRTWFCQKQLKSQADASNVGLDIGYDDFDLGYDDKKENWSEFYSDYCRDESFNAQFKQKTEAFVKKINGDVVKAAKECLIAKGLHARIEQGADPYYFRFVTQYIPHSNNDRLPKVESFVVKNATCAGVLREGFKIGFDETIMLCTRSDQPVEVGFDATSSIINDTPMGLARTVKPNPNDTSKVIYPLPGQYVVCPNSARITGVHQNNTEESFRFGRSSIMVQAPHANINGQDYVRLSVNGTFMANQFGVVGFRTGTISIICDG